MLLRRTTTTTAVAAAVFHLANTTEFSLIFFSTATTSNISKPFAKISSKYRCQAIQEWQKALRDYLHTTRSLPFLYADYISKNSPHSLSEIVSKIPFSPSNFVRSFQRYLRYHPINEFDFFFESIGLNCEKNRGMSCILHKNTFYISDWERFDVVCALAGAGLPWGKLGLLLREDFKIFEVNPSELKRRIGEMKDSYGFDSVSMIGICLAFPQVLHSNADGLLGDLKILFLDYDLLSCLETNVDVVIEICEIIKLFYCLGCEMGKVGKLLGRSKHVFVEHTKEHLSSMIEYFCRLDVGRDEVGLLLLSRPDLLVFDVGDQVISVSQLLAHFGMGEEELKSLKEKYPHVFGRNRLANVPHAMRAMDLGKWFFDRIRKGDPSLLASCTTMCTEDSDEQYEEGLRKSLAKRTRAYTKTKLHFIHSLGFGENKFAINALTKMHGNGSDLRRRFDFLLGCGIEYSKLCSMLKLVPMVLNQRTNLLEKKIDYLCREMGLSLQYLDNFPGYLCFDLEKRIKPRYRFHKWLKENGYCKRNYALASIISSSDKEFTARVSRMNHAAAKMWREAY